VWKIQNEIVFTYLSRSNLYGKWLFLYPICHAIPKYLFDWKVHSSEDKNGQFVENTKWWEHPKSKNKSQANNLENLSFIDIPKSYLHFSD
jgi:hypothetical protein